jgi:hypothetical protein
MLEIGQSTTITIQARKKWNDTGIQLIAGEEYQFTATGEWIDWFIRCGADGFPSRNLMLRITEWQRRVPQENWFALMGALDFDKNSIFRIGQGRTLVLNRSGILTCFANDISYMYWNNRGSIQLTLTRKIGQIGS